MTKQKNNYKVSDVPIYPTYAVSCVELAERFKLPKQKVKSELERIVRKINAADYSLLAKKEGFDLVQLMSEISVDSVERVLDKAKKEGVGKDLIREAATNYIKAYIKTSEDILGDEKDMTRFQKKYSIPEEVIYNAILDYYHKDMR